MCVTEAEQRACIYGFEITQLHLLESCKGHDAIHKTAKHHILAGRHGYRTAGADRSNRENKNLGVPCHQNSLLIPFSKALPGRLTIHSSLGPTTMINAVAMAHKGGLGFPTLCSNPISMDLPRAKAAQARPEVR